MSAAERLMALFVAPSREAPVSTPAESGPAERLPERGDAAPQPVAALSPPGAARPESLAAWSYSGLGNGAAPSPIGIARPPLRPSLRSGKRRKPRPACNVEARSANASIVGGTSAHSHEASIHPTLAASGAGTQPGAPRLRVAPVLEDEDAEPSSGITPARHPVLPPGPGVGVCVLGGGRAATSFALALAARLARLPGARCAVVCAAPPASGAAPTRPPGLSGPTAPAARRISRGLVADGHEASVRGRVVEVALTDAPGSVGAGLVAVRGRAPDAPMLTLLPGPRSFALDVVIGRQDLVLAVVSADASPALSALAVAELTRVAPGAVVRAVPLPGRLGASARRAAVTRALDALR